MMLGLTGVTLIAIVATLLLIFFTVIFFAFWNRPNQKKLIISNQTKNQLNILISSTSLDGSTVTLPAISVPAGDSILTVNLYPGTIVYVQAYTSVTSNLDTLTTGILATGGFLSSGQLSVSNSQSTNTSLTGLLTTGNDLDFYGVSLQSGFNLKMTLSPEGENQSKSGLTCGSQVWSDTVTCPAPLKGSDGCLNPCVLGVEYCDNTSNCTNSWPNLDYYHDFNNACPSCLVGQCEGLNFSCSSQTYLLNIFE